MRLVKIPFDSALFRNDYSYSHSVYINPENVEFLIYFEDYQQYNVQIRTKAGHTLPFASQVYRSEEDAQEYLDTVLRLLQDTQAPPVKDEMTGLQYREWISYEFDKLALKVLQLQSENETLKDSLKSQREYLQDRVREMERSLETKRDI